MLSKKWCYFVHQYLVETILLFRCSGKLCRMHMFVTPCISHLAELHGDLFSHHASHHASPLKVMFLWWSTKEVNNLRPTRFVVDATENSEVGGVATEVCGSHTRLWFCTILWDIYARIRTSYTYGQMYSAEKERGQVSGWTCRTCVQNFRVYLLGTSWTLSFGAENMYQVYFT